MLIQEAVKMLGDLIDTVQVLNDLIRTSTDRKRAFVEAAGKATTPELKVLFQRHSADCAAAVIELQRLVRSIGGTPKSGGTVAGIGHRSWLKLKTAIGDANVALLEDMVRSEDQAAKAYTKALTAGLPPQIRSVVQRQHYGAVRNLNLISDLHHCHTISIEAVTARNQSDFRAN